MLACIPRRRQSAGGARDDDQEARPAESAEQIKGGIAEQESRISVSNVMLVCAACGPVRSRTRSAWRPQSTSLQEVRNNAR